jgi:hypothetical protein
MDGPVVTDAKAALEKGDVTPVLKWVKKEQEGEVLEAFNKAMAVRNLRPGPQEIADRYFFETVVRLHRASEGAAYTGLKPAGTDVGPAVTAADKALEKGSAEELAKLVTDSVSRGIHERFGRALEKRKRKDESIEDGREYVEAYVEFLHYAERLYDDATGPAGRHEQERAR